MGLGQIKRPLCNVKLEFVKQEETPVLEATWAEKPQQTPSSGKSRGLFHSWETKPHACVLPLPSPACCKVGFTQANQHRLQTMLCTQCS